MLTELLDPQGRDPSADSSSTALRARALRVPSGDGAVRHPCTPLRCAAQGQGCRRQAFGPFDVPELCCIFKSRRRR